MTDGALSPARAAARTDAFMEKLRHLTTSSLALATLLLGGIIAAPSPALAQLTEVEPNDQCTIAQDLGAATLPFSLLGSLDSTPDVPDIDFFRFTGAPGDRVRVDLQGASSGKGTLGDPFLGVFDSGCNLIAVVDDGGIGVDSRVTLTIPADGIVVLAATVCCDSSFIGGGVGSYELAVAQIAEISSISGRIVDAVTAQPLPGNTEPFAFVRLLRCDDAGCNDVNSQPADGEGRFRFEQDFSGQPLEVGTFQVLATADEYQQGQTDPFAVAKGEDHDVGDVRLEPFPVRISTVEPCGNIPPEGGRCRYGARITNRSGTELTALAWSLVQGSGLGSLTDATEFQAGMRSARLPSRQFKDLRFEFTVPGDVQAGAFLCTTLTVGRRPGAFFDTLESAQLFCISKEAAGFKVMAEKKAHQLFRQLSGRLLTPPKPSH